MSVSLSSIAWSQYRGGHVDKLVLLSLCDHADHDGLCFPSVATIAAECCASESSVRRSIDALTRSGWLRIVAAGGWIGSRNRSNTYRVQPPAAAVDGFAAAQHQRRQRQESNRTAEACQEAPAEAPEGQADPLPPSDHSPPTVGGPPSYHRGTVPLRWDPNRNGTGIDSSATPPLPTTSASPQGGEAPAEPSPGEEAPAGPQQSAASPPAPPSEQAAALAFDHRDAWPDLRRQIEAMGCEASRRRSVGWLGLARELHGPGPLDWRRAATLIRSAIRAQRWRAEERGHKPPRYPDQIEPTTIEQIRTQRTQETT